MKVKAKAGGWTERELQSVLTWLVAQAGVSFQCRLMKMFPWQEGFDCPAAKLLADSKTACFISSSFSRRTLALVNVTIKHGQCRNLITKPFILLKEK